MLLFIVSEKKYYEAFVAFVRSGFILVLCKQTFPDYFYANVDTDFSLKRAIKRQYPAV